MRKTLNSLQISETVKADPSTITLSDTHAGNEKEALKLKGTLASLGLE